MSSYSFKDLQESDLHIIGKWLKEPHVKKIWDDGESWEESHEKYLFRTSSDKVKQFLVYYQNKPIGYIQFYWASKVGDGWWEGFSDDVIGIDQYIGEIEFLGKGHGTQFIKEFLIYSKERYNFSKVICDPSPDNKRAIRCYEKVGFKNLGEVGTPDGLALLMEYRP